MAQGEGVINMPAKSRLTRLYWAVTLFNAMDGTMPETPQLLPSVNEYDKPEASADWVDRAVVRPGGARRSQQHGLDPVHSRPRPTRRRTALWRRHRLLQRQAVDDGVRATGTGEGESRGEVNVHATCHPAPDMTGVAAKYCLKSGAACYRGLPFQPSGGAVEVWPTCRAA